MKRSILSVCFIMSLSLAEGQRKIPFDTIAAIKRYDSAFLQIQDMLSGVKPLSFKKAVFLSEYAYLESEHPIEKYEREISRLKRLCERVIERGGLIYDERDKDDVAKYAAVFTVMKQLQVVEKDSLTGAIKPVAPFKYDFDDFWGEWDWSKMFVTKLLDTKAGNCHSLPFLYKILCEELGVNAYLAMAPNHIYIKHHCRKLGWYNTELTSGYFPIDAWIMASGYVHLNAIQNGVYMDTLSQKQSIAVCLVDLAKGFEKKFGRNADNNFLLKCADLALMYYPNYVNGLILKAETFKKQFEIYMLEQKAQYPSDIFSNPLARAKFEEMEKLYFHIHNIGYRMMPKEMYLSWLDELKEEREKYTDKKVVKEFNTK